MNEVISDFMLEGSEGEQRAEHAAAGRRSTLVSVWTNLGLTATQVSAGLLSGSQGLVADGIHSLSDLVADGVVLLAMRHSAKAADDDHHYGHHRYENLASLVLGLLLLAVGLGMVWSAVGKLQSPGDIAPVGQLALWVVLAALAAKELLFRYMSAVARRVRSSLLMANAWHARSDAASSLVVAVGIGGNLLGYPLLDPLAAVIVGLMVARMGWHFLMEAAHDLTDRAVSPDELRRIEDDIRATPGVQGFHNLRTRRAGDMILVDVHLDVSADLRVADGHDIALRVRERVMDRHPVLNVMTHIDPV